MQPSNSDSLSLLLRCLWRGCVRACRYAELLRQGSRHWGLEGRYVAWLEGLATVEPSQRGDRYYRRASDGAPLPALPKIRTGSVGGGQQGRGQRRPRGGGGGRPHQRAQQYY